MENIIFQKSSNEQGKVTEIEIGGMLVLENSSQLKKEFVGVVDYLSERVLITISNVEEIDLSFVQLLVAFKKSVLEKHTAFELVWKIDEEQKLLFDNVGLSTELFMN